jgi:ParB family chromosome partitioning protein
MARDLTGLKERGYSHQEIAALVGVSETYVLQLVRLVENGEERLITAVERGDLPITAAIEIAATDDVTMQRSLQEAYDSGQLRGKSLLKMRRIIEERRARGKGMRTGSKDKKSTSPHDLVRALRKETHKQELLVKKARLCEQQLRFIVSALKDLMADDSFVKILRAEKLDSLPRCLGEMIGK